MEDKAPPLPASLAWDAFGEKNGVASFDELRTRIRHYRREDDAIDPVIGCNVLAEPFFLRQPDWIPVPQSWARNIVQGKTYDTGSQEGRAPESVELALSRHGRVQEPPVAEDFSENSPETMTNVCACVSRLPETAAL